MLKKQLEKTTPTPCKGVALRYGWAEMQVASSNDVHVAVLDVICCSDLVLLVKAMQTICTT